MVQELALGIDGPEEGAYGPNKIPFLSMPAVFFRCRFNSGLFVNLQQGEIAGGLSDLLPSSFVSRRAWDA